MTDHDEHDQLPDPQPEPVQTVPMLRVHGEGYITRKDTGERVPFTFEGEGRL